MESARNLILGSRCIFQQDNYPKHLAEAMQEWLLTVIMSSYDYISVQISVQDDL